MFLASLVSSDAVDLSSAAFWLSPEEAGGAVVFSCVNACFSCDVLDHSCAGLRSILDETAAGGATVFSFTIAFFASVVDSEGAPEFGFDSCFFAAAEEKGVGPEVVGVGLSLANGGRLASDGSFGFEKAAAMDPTFPDVGLSFTNVCLASEGSSDGACTPLVSLDDGPSCLVVGPNFSNLCLACANPVDREDTSELNEVRDPRAGFEPLSVVSSGGELSLERCSSVLSSSIEFSDLCFGKLLDVFFSNSEGEGSGSSMSATICCGTTRTTQYIM